MKLKKTFHFYLWLTRFIHNSCEFNFNYQIKNIFFRFQRFQRKGNEGTLHNSKHSSVSKQKRLIFFDKPLSLPCVFLRCKTSNLSNNIYVLVTSPFLTTFYGVFTVTARKKLNI